MSLIKPMATTNTAINLAKNVFGFTEILQVKELISFCDRNFYIKGSRNNQLQGQEFVLKILNSVDSQYTEQLDAELKVSQFLRTRGFPCPETFNVEGTSERMAFVELPASSSIINENTLAVNKESCVVRLIAFLSGDEVDSLERSPELMFTVGKLAGAISLELKDFSHPGLKLRSEQNFRWDILEFLNLDNYIGHLEEKDKIKLLREVHDAFVAKVKPKLKHFRRGAVHNDLNGENILVSRPPYVVTGVLDFGDSMESVLISDLSNAMAFVMEGDRGIEFSGYLLAGYQSVFPLPKQERDLLYYFVAARISQLALYSQCSLIEQPYDESLQACLNKYWSILTSFWSKSKGEVEKIWQKYELNCLS